MFLKSILVEKVVVPFVSFLFLFHNVATGQEPSREMEEPESNLHFVPSKEMRFYSVPIEKGLPESFGRIDLLKNFPELNQVDAEFGWFTCLGSPANGIFELSL